jgi:hypothetical protein
MGRKVAVGYMERIQARRTVMEDRNKKAIGK